MRHLVPIVILMFFGARVSGQEETRFPSEHARVRRVTDQDLQNLPNPERLEVVVLRGPHGFGADDITDAGIAHLARCPNLRVLRAGAFGPRLTDRALETVGKLANLEELVLDGNAITGEGLRHLVGLKKLRKLDLHFNPLRPEAFKALGKLTGLVHLGAIVYKIPVDDDILESLSRLTHLERLRLADNTAGVTDRGLEHLGRLRHLRNMTLRDAPGVTDVGLGSLAGLPLEELSLSSLREVSPRGLDILAKLPRLRRLELDSVPMDDASIRALTPLTKLETLLLWNVSLGRLALDPLGELRSLRTFRTNLVVPRPAIRALAKLPHLESITEELTEVTDEDLAHLAKLPKLHTLILDSDKVTAAALPALAKMDALRELFVTDRVRVTPAEWSSLGRASLPRCRISRYRPPYTVYHQPVDRAN